MIDNLSVRNLGNRPHTTVILAMSADGKIADRNRSPARFGSAQDKAHLETQIAKVDGVLFGRGTLQAYGTTLSVSSPELLQHRQCQGQSPQPVQIVCSSSGKINPNLRFFQQPVPRCLLTTSQGLTQFKQGFLNSNPSNQSNIYDCFQDLIITKTLLENPDLIDWKDAFQHLMQRGVKRLAVLGGGQLVSSLFLINFIDELWLTVCPLILGGVNAPTPVEGIGFLCDFAPRLQLLEVKQVEQEVFLHYKVK
ncbi:MAG: RibD family protein [Cyanobacteriota bacterium]|nr:RibD family protein [Cyanobacteriota bacterium]